MYTSHLGTFFLSAQNKGGEWCKKKKNTNLRKHKASLIPPIKPLEGPNQRIRSAHRHRIKELNSQVWELQQQLSGVATENKLLKQLQGRQAVALQRFQDSQSGLPQVCCSKKKIGLE